MAYKSTLACLTRVVNKIFFLLIILCNVGNLSFAQNIDPQSMVSVECKTGQEDRGVPIFTDMSFGVSGDSLIHFFKDLNINTIRIPLVKAVFDQKRADLVIDFLQKINGAGGSYIKIILDQRKWNLEQETKQQEWANHIGYVYNAIKEAGLDSMVVGCMFDENAPLEGEQSTEELWIAHLTGVLGAMSKLNEITNNAFKSRTVFIHGKGYGSQFYGVKAAIKSINFNTLIKAQCANYAFDFKYFQAGEPTDKTLEGWRNHYKTYCAFQEVKDLDIPMIFVGDAGDGLRANSFIQGKNPYGSVGQYVIRALRDIFVEYGWSGLSFGTCFIDSTSTTEGRTVLTTVTNSQLTLNVDVVDSWETWLRTTKLNTLATNPETKIFSLVFNQNKRIITITTEQDDPVNFLMFDINGRKIISASFTKKREFYLPYVSGVYFYLMEENGYKKSGKIFLK